MQLVITVKDGATNKDIAAALRFQANLIAGMEPKAAAARENTDTAEETEDEDDGFTETPPKSGKGTKGKKSQAAASFDEDDGGDDTVDETEDEDFTAPPKGKAAKGKKVTIDMVNDACKAKAADSSRKEVLALLKKHFKTQSVSEIKPELYAKVIEVMEV